MDINTLTIEELKELMRTILAEMPTVPTTHPFVGKYVLCRCYTAGVHVGELVVLNGEQAILRNSRRLWMWKARSGVALSGVAQNGLARSGCKIDTENPEIALSGIIEVIPCSTTAQESIRGYISE